MAEKYQVIIVGGGPVGVGLAVELGQRGISCAVNAEFARMHATVHDGDEVAFLPPVSGGSR